jgi:hypothetical protein
MLYTLDFKKVLLLVGTSRIQGFADGEGFTFDLDEDLYTKTTGADGDTARSRRHGQSANLKINLMQTSPSNDILMALAVLDRVNNAGVVPVTVKDLLGTTLIFAPYCWVKKTPPAAFGKEVASREWMIDIANTELYIGGNIAAFGV